ncbi:hypothetical protein JOD31_003236 [Methylopila capsulata]|uniref:Secreted protein n=1 Tax=Methylopila capsulata TaxID=61654 RepID=A0A9W6IYW7_9HYPH|nr:hypothetical protein [Methylopila capsulata]MBM7852985.1 hypothetical protein [Methylopila capsulata]GLK57804.1 hypothetical protein GCM10008170_38240 [Methylopila capsulata]
MPIARLSAALAATALLGGGALAQTPEPQPDHAFLAAPQVDLNRMYRVDRATGEMGSCQYAVKDGTVGVTLCFPAGEGAGAQQPGVYDLVASNHSREGGVFRVDRRSGRMSSCYVLGEQVVCTPLAR